MPLLRNGILEQTSHAYLLENDMAKPKTDSTAKVEAVVSLDRFLEMAADDSAVTTQQVWLEPEHDVALLAPYVKNLELICVHFPSFTDGRGYSHARLLSKRYSYTGELRAVGDIRVDHILFMLRSGLNAFQFEATPNEALLQTLLHRYNHNYQPTYKLPQAS